MQAIRTFHLSIFGMYGLPTILTMVIIFKDTTVREQGVVQTIWTEYMTEPSYHLYINFKILSGRCGDLLLLWPPTASLLLMELAGYESGVGCFFLWSLLALCVRVLFHISPRKLLRLQTSSGTGMCCLLKDLFSSPFQPP